MIQGWITGDQWVPQVNLREDRMPAGPLELAGVLIECKGIHVTVPVVLLPELIKMLETFRPSLGR
jgi:hypothetical protein